MKRILIVLECERYIQPFMRAMLMIAQKYYDVVYIITNPITKGNSIEGEKIVHVENPNSVRRRSMLLSPLRLFSKDILNHALIAIKTRRFNKEFFKSIKLYVCYGMAFYRTTLPIVNRHRNDCNIHILACWFFVEACVAGFFKKKYNKIKTFSLAHSFEIDPLKNNFVDLSFNQWKHQYLDGIYFISSKMLGIYNQATNGIYQKVYGSKMYVSYLGCIKKFPELNPYMKFNKIRIVSCSYVRVEKRLDLILEVMSLWSLCPIEWVHIGNGPMFEQMVQRSKQIMAKNPQVVIDFRGYKSNEDVQLFYTKEQVDCFINLSVSEGVPVAIMEAIAYGIPVIATNVGGVSEIVQEQYGILLSAEDDAVTIKARLEAFISTYKEDAIQMRVHANKFWQEKFNAEKNYNTFFETLRE